MRKELGLIVMGAVAFDLGTVVVPAQAADAIYMKYDALPSTFNFHKFDAKDASAANACVAGKGTLSEFKGDKYCRTDKTGPAAAVPSNQRK